jgi:glucokinase
MILAGDIGGTKTLLRAVGDDGSTVAEQRYESADWQSFDALLDDFLGRLGGRPDASCFAVAGPVWGGRAEITNLHWVMDGAKLGATLINDFHAVALGVMELGDDDLIAIHRGRRDRTQPMAVLGAGTGLGQALIVNGGVVTTEGGHQDFAPQDEEQTRLFLHLHRIYGHVSWERVVSGMGLVNIFTFLGGGELDPAEIAGLAENGDARARRTFEIFVDTYGAAAGNMALSVLARGGVFLAGGIAAKNIPWFTDGRFVEAFRRKGRFRELMETIPVDLITREDAGLLGAIAAARRSLESR